MGFIKTIFRIMSRESIISLNSKEANSIINRVRGNLPFLNQNDLKILEFLSKKGLFEDKEVILVNKK